MISRSQLLSVHRLAAAQSALDPTMESTASRYFMLLIASRNYSLTISQPTWNAISREGLAVYSLTLDTLGLYARSIADLQLLSNVFRLADDTPIPPSPFQIPGAKIAFTKTHIWPKAGPGLKAAWEKAKALLESKGAVVEELEMPEEFGNITEWHDRVCKGEGRSSFLGSKYFASIQTSDHTVFSL